MNDDRHGGQQEDQQEEEELTGFAKVAGSVFLTVETLAYMILGALLALTTLVGIGSAAGALWSAVLQHAEPNGIVITIDRLLFVLMLVEILHTVRVSFRSGTLVCEPFLIVGLIASIRRVLVITLKSSQSSPPTPGAATEAMKTMLDETMLELVVLAVLILVMVVSIALLRRSATGNRKPAG